MVERPPAEAIAAMPRIAAWRVAKDGTTVDGTVAVEVHAANRFRFHDWRDLDGENMQEPWPYQHVYHVDLVALKALPVPPSD